MSLHLITRFHAATRRTAYKPCRSLWSVSEALLVVATFMLLWLALVILGGN